MKWKLPRPRWHPASHRWYWKFAIIKRFCQRCRMMFRWEWGATQWVHSVETRSDKGQTWQQTAFRDYYLCGGCAKHETVFNMEWD